MIIDGRALAESILTSVRERISTVSHTPVVRAITIAPTKATESYLKIKTARAALAGMTLEVVRLADDASEEDILSALAAPGADALIVQLPLPAHLDTERVCNLIPKSQDADVLSSAAYSAFTTQEKGALIPPVALAVQEILTFTHTSISEKRVAIVGKGRLVGAPAAALLASLGAQVEVFDKGDGYEEKLKDYDIVVLGAGVAGLITPELLKSGVVLIDAGTSESGGVLVGDADPRCADVASVFIPVPGGVGPVAVACLFKNVADLVGV